MKIVKQLTQGAQANKAGKVFELCLAAILSENDIAFEYHRKFGEGIWGERIKVDFFLPEHELIVEARWQDGPGSANLKLNYLLDNIREKYPHPTMVVLGGSKWSECGCIPWAKRQIVPDGKLKRVLQFEEFISWTHRSVELRQWIICNPMVPANYRQKKVIACCNLNEISKKDSEPFT